MEDNKDVFTGEVVPTMGDPSLNNNLTLSELREAIPKRFSKAVNQEFVDYLNNLSSDVMETTYIKENLLSYGSVLNDGKFKLMDYVNAVKYLSFLMLNHTKASAYSRTFPERYNKLVQAGKDQRYISAYVSAYDNGMLVNEIRKQTLVPVYIHNRALLQKAINVQAKEMLNEKNSAFVRITASKNLMDALKEPMEVAQLNIAVNTGGEGNGAINALTEALNNLTAQQEKAIERGEITTKEVAESSIVVAEYEDV